jgi:RNA polymerase sigma-70 factor (ECF subfamily)
LELEFAVVNGQLGLVLTQAEPDDVLSGRRKRVMGFTVRDGLVWGAYDVANPDKLSGLHLG